MHEHHVSWLNFSLFDNLPAEFRTSVGFRLSYQTDIVVDNRVNVRTPDIAIIHSAEPNKQNIIGVVEVGLTQTFADLKRWRDIWFRGVDQIDRKTTFSSSRDSRIN
jgi:hypothetical protein